MSMNIISSLWGGASPAAGNGVPFQAAEPPPVTSYPGQQTTASQPPPPAMNALGTGPGEQEKSSVDSSAANGEGTIGLGAQETEKQ